MAEEKTVGSQWDARDLPEWMKGHDPPDWMIEGEKPFKAGDKEIAPVPFRQTYNIDQYLVDMLGEEPFFAGIFMQMNKVTTLSIPTMAVTFANDQFTLLVNPNFVQRLHDQNRKADIVSVLMHEGIHPVHGHITSRWSKGLHKKAWNWAADMANNDFLTRSMSRKLPSCPIVPGLRPGMPFDMKADPPKDPVSFEKWFKAKPSPLEKAVMDAPRGQATEFYYQLILPHMEDEEKNGKCSGPPDNEPGTDDHDVWGDTPPEEPSYMEERAKDLLRRAVDHADRKGNWGSVPAEMQKTLRKLLSPQVDWTEELREWTGNQFVSREKHGSITKINKKYPYIQPGKRRSRGISVLVASDQSGSVGNKLMELLCAEISGILDIAKVTFVAFDTSVDLSSVKEWEPGDSPVVYRSRYGGTDFSPVTAWANSDKNRDRFDVMYVLTDGEAAKPISSRIPRLWILPEGKKLPFPSEEKVVHVPSSRLGIT